MPFTHSIFIFTMVNDYMPFVVILKATKDRSRITNQDSILSNNTGYNRLNGIAPFIWHNGHNRITLALNHAKNWYFFRFNSCFSYLLSFRLTHIFYLTAYPG